MSTPFEDQIAQAAAEVERQQDELRRTRAELATTSAQVTSRNHLVTATVLVGGRIRSLKFADQQYATMAPAELADLLVETVNEAHDKVTAKARAQAAGPREVIDGLRDSLLAGAGMDDLFAGLSDLLGPEGPGGSAARYPEED